MEIRCRPADWAEIQSFLADFSELYRMAGGSGLWIHARKARASPYDRPARAWLATGNR